ncbi:hypothetical protein DRO91_10525 [Candidatus Heimdallarchaeota archaeon]|nr:MAG: hypothetical protein DRO91_10525 [Candidatus Heimdallarchaeota archaeon]
MKKLQESFGNVNFSDKDYEKAAYSSDASQIDGKLDAVVWPTSIEKVHELVNYCRRLKINLNVRGGGTSLSGGCTPTGGIVVDMAKMNRIIEVNEEERYAITEAGVVLDELNRKMKKSFFPVIPGSRKACTIGGMVATNASGLKTREYGKMEDWVEELEVVDGTGRYLKIKGKAIKNFCGAEGSTGIVVRAKLRLAQKPRQRTLSILKFNTITAMMEKIEELEKNENVKNLIFIDEICSELLDFDERNHLVVEYDNDDGNIQEEDESNTVWNMLENLRHIVIQQRLPRVEDPCIPLTDMGRFLYWLKKRNIPSYGPVGAGTVYTFFQKDSREIEEMYKTVRKLNGRISYSHGLGILKKNYAAKEEAAKIIALKQIHDPELIMNKGV